MSSSRYLIEEHSAQLGKWLVVAGAPTLITGRVKLRLFLERNKDRDPRSFRVRDSQETIDTHSRTV